MANETTSTTTSTTDSTIDSNSNTVKESSTQDLIDLINKDYAEFKSENNEHYKNIDTKLDTLISQTAVQSQEESTAVHNSISYYADLCIVFLVMGVLPIYFIYRLVRSQFSLIDYLI